MPSGPNPSHLLMLIILSEVNMNIHRFVDVTEFPGMLLPSNRLTLQLVSNDIELV